jgi:ActR/RegA family two-component response regulator
VAGREAVVKSSIRVERPPIVFRLLAEDRIDLDAVKREYIRAVYYRTQNISEAARVLKVSPAMVREYCE